MGTGTAERDHECCRRLRAPRVLPKARQGRANTPGERSGNQLPAIQRHTRRRPGTPAADAGPPPAKRADGMSPTRPGSRRQILGRERRGERRRGITEADELQAAGPRPARARTVCPPPDQAAGARYQAENGEVNGERTTPDTGRRGASSIRTPVSPPSSCHATGTGPARGASSIRPVHRLTASPRADTPGAHRHAAAAGRTYHPVPGKTCQHCPSRSAQPARPHHTQQARNQNPAK